MSNGPAAQVDLLFAGGDITRYHTQRQHAPQSVAHHSARMAMLLTVVNPQCSAALLAACLYHDISELATGDLLGPAKWEYPALAAAANEVTSAFEQKNDLRWPLTVDEQRMVKWADRMEGAIYSWEQVFMGNRFMHRSLHAYLEALRGLPPFDGPEHQARRRIIEIHYTQKYERERTR